jgi:hypothetical protein
MSRDPVQAVSLPGWRAHPGALAILGGVGSALLLASPAAALPAPGDSEPTASLVSEQTGAARLRIPIEAPPGPGGFAPELALSYSSHAGDGPFGVGWSLNLGEIRCSARFGVPDDASCETYEFGGTLLVANPDTPGAYHTIVESFQRIRRIGDSWTVEQPDGTKLVFGEATTHRVSQSGSTARWLLQRMEDAFGNPIWFQYDTTIDPGEAHPLTISWGAGSSPGSGPRQIEFTYEGRPDPRLVFAGGLRRSLTRRVREIRVFGHQQLARRYLLGYAAAGAYTTERSRLAWVQEFGSDCTNLGEDPVPGVGCSALPRRTFEYRDANDVSPSGVSSQWSANDNAYRIPLGSYADGAPRYWKKSYPQRIADLNGDGLADRLELSITQKLQPGTIRVWINTGSGFHGKDDPSPWGATAQQYTDSFNGLTYSKPR